MDPLTKIAIGIGIAIALGIITTQMRTQWFRTYGSATTSQMIAVLRSRPGRSDTGPLCTVLIEYRAPGEYTLQRRSINVNSRKLSGIAPEVGEIGRNVMDLNKLVARGKEAANLRRRMLDQGHTEQDVLQAVHDLTMSRIEERKQLAMGLDLDPERWDGLPRVTDLPLIIHPTKPHRIMVDYRSL